MIAKFKVINLVVNVAPEDDPGYCRHSYYPATNCADKSCKGEDCRGDTFKAATNCDRPTCKEPPPRRDGEVDEPARNTLALLQKELRQALDLGR